MTRLNGATVEEFKKALEVMRMVYPFKDEETYIVSDTDLYSYEHTQLEIHTVDKTGVRVDLSCDVKAVTGEKEDAD